MPKNKFTLVTGASEGFGKALALECASRKQNLVLVALPGPALYSLADCIRQTYKVQAITFEKDLTIETECISLFEEICEMDLCVNTLINNAGLGSTMFFGEGTMSFYQRQVKLNVLATTMLTYLFLEMLRKNGPSHILNVGSLSSFFFLPKKQVYGATKSFIYSFSKSLRTELETDNVSVSVICPGAMKTNASVSLLIKGSGWLSRLASMQPEQVAPLAISGLLSNKEVIIPGLVNRVFLLMDKLLPSAVKKLLIAHQMKNTISVTALESKVQTRVLTANRIVINEEMH